MQCNGQGRRKQDCAEPYYLHQFQKLILTNINVNNRAFSESRLSYRPYDLGIQFTSINLKLGHRQCIGLIGLNDASIEWPGQIFMTFSNLPPGGNLLVSAFRNPTRNRESKPTYSNWFKLQFFNLSILICCYITFLRVIPQRSDIRNYSIFVTYHRKPESLKIKSYRKNHSPRTNPLFF